MIKKSKLKNLTIALVSLFFALLLFLTAKATAYTSKGSRVTTYTETYTHTVDNVPIDIKYDSSSYFISGYSYDVEVYLSSTNRVKLDSEINADTRKFKVVADLSELGEGTHQVELEVKDLPRDVNAQITPTTMTVTIGRRETQTFSIEPELTEDQIGSAYVLQSVTLNIDEVTVTSDEATISQIERVIAVLPSDTVLTSKSFTDEVTIQALSENGTILPVITSPAKAEMTVKLKKLTKTVPLTVELTGEMDSSLSEIAYELGMSEVIISGSQEALDAVDQVLVKVDVTDIKKDTRKTVTLSADNVSVTPEVVDVKLTVTKK